MLRAVRKGRLTRAQAIERLEAVGERSSLHIRLDLIAEVIETLRSEK